MANKTTKAFEATIKAYLDEHAELDTVFAEKYANESKSIKECCNFIVEQVQKSGRNGFTDDEIFGMALHYYDENDVSVGKQNCNIVVNHVVELTDEEKDELRKQAAREVIEEAKRKLTEKPKPKKDDAIPMEEQSLFDFDEL